VLRFAHILFVHECEAWCRALGRHERSLEEVGKRRIGR
jgi:hypothetical protein